MGTATDSVLASLKVTVADSSVNGNGSAVDETAAASREYCATSSPDRRGLDRADAKRYSGKLNDRLCRVLSTAI